MNNAKLRIPFRVILAFTASLFLYGTASAQNDQVKGVINSRSGATMTCKTGMVSGIVEVSTSLFRLGTASGVRLIGEAATELLHIGKMVFDNGLTIDEFIAQVFNYAALSET